MFMAKVSVLCTVIILNDHFAFIVHSKWSCGVTILNSQIVHVFSLCILLMSSYYFTIKYEVMKAVSIIMTKQLVICHLK